MRMCKKRTLSLILTLALIVGCFAGTGMTVKASDITAITSVNADKTELGSAGGKITVTVIGENLKEKIWWRMRTKDGYSYEDVEGMNKCEAPITDSSKAEFEVVIPKNDSDAVVKYQIDIHYKEPVTAWTGCDKIMVTVAASDGSVETVDKTELAKVIADAKSRTEQDYEAVGWAAMQEKLQVAETVNNNEQATAAQVKEAQDALQAALDALVLKTATITKVTATPTEIPTNGGTVQLKVEGTNLTSTNWGIKSESFISGTQQPASDKTGQVSVKEITESGAAIEISSNGMKNDVDFVLSVGPKKGDIIEKQKEVTVKQLAKTYSTTSLTPESVVLADDRTVVAEFAEDISAVEGADLKKLIYIADTSGENRHNLTDDGKVTIDNKKVIVEYAEPLSDIGTTSYLYIKEGAMTTVVNKETLVVSDIKWLIQTTTRVSSITVDKDLFNHKGGTVTAVLNGYKVEEIDLEKDLTAAVYIPGETQASDIAVSKTKNEEGKPVLTFAVPENKTANTMSYWLNVKYKNTPVYESAADSRGQRTTISVLPVGKTDKDVTLSMVTISGNNKTEVNNTKDIEVQVSNNIGELKTELRVYGTNLNSELTKVRAVDENGIVWPVYQISECDGTWRFIAIAGPNRNGVFGDGNSQLIELLPPRYAGTNKTYRIQVALDGKNFIEEPCVTLKVNNEGISGEYEFRDCTSANFKYVTVKYVDESGKELADKDVYKGYCISMPESFGIAPKQIAGYKLIKEPELDEWVEEGRTYSYVYRSTSTSSGTDIKDTTTNKEPIKVSSIKLSAASKKIAAGKKVQMRTEVFPANATNKAVTYKTSNKKYATVSASGKVTLKKAGAGKTVTITATAADGSGKKASYKITIMKNAVKSVKLKSAKTVKAGKKLKVKATVKTTGKKVNKKLKWTSSNTKYATVSASGVVKTKKAGKGKTVKITAVSTDGSNKKGTVKIKIK